jgi:soluble lytic murein transglycosylase-like protein
MTRSAGPLLACALALVSGQANAQAGAAAPAAVHPEAGQPTVPIEPPPPAANRPTADDVCLTLEQSAAENGLPVEFFARVIWQESRFNARAVSPKGASGIAQFMPQTAGWHGLADPFDPIEALRHSAGYLRELRDRFGNLGLAAAAYNAGPGRVSAWLTSHRPLPGETRNYVAIVTGWTWTNGRPGRRRRRRTPLFRRAYLVLGSPI